MRCPFCHFSESKVTDSRNAADCNAIRRRRECLQCGRRFTTFETMDLSVQVRKRDGTYEDFQYHKLLNGILAACRHTRISHDRAKALATQITQQLMERQIREVSTQELGDLVMEHLQGLDPVAWIRFACVYRRFQDIGEVREAIEAVQPKDGPHEHIALH
ncbi:MAG: transcriptional regulator NrdR [Chlamydiia bacterium]